MRASRIVVCLTLCAAGVVRANEPGNEKPSFFTHKVYDFWVDVERNVAPNDPTLPRSTQLVIVVSARTVVSPLILSDGPATATIHFGDGESVRFDGRGAGSGGTFTLAHTYTIAGLRTINVERDPGTSLSGVAPDPTGWFRTVAGPAPSFDPGLSFGDSTLRIGEPVTCTIASFPPFGTDHLTLNFNDSALFTFTPDQMTATSTFTVAGAYPLIWLPGVVWSDDSVLEILPAPTLNVLPAEDLVEHLVVESVDRLQLGGAGQTDANNEFNQRNVRLANNDRTLFFLSESSWGRNQIYRIDESPANSGLFEGFAVPIDVDPNASQLPRPNSTSFPAPVNHVGTNVLGFEVAPDLSLMLVRMGSNNSNPRWLIYRNPFGTSPRVVPVEVAGVEPWTPLLEPWPDVAIDPFTMMATDGSALFLPAGLGAPYSGVERLSAYTLSEDAPALSPRFQRTPAEDLGLDQLSRLNALGRIRLWQSLDQHQQQLFAAITDQAGSLYTDRTTEAVTEEFGWDALKDTASTWVELGALTADGRHLYFASNRRDSAGMMDIYRANLGIVMGGTNGVLQRVRALIGEEVGAGPAALDENRDEVFDSADVPPAKAP